MSKHKQAALFSSILFPYLDVTSHYVLLMTSRVDWQPEVKSSWKNETTCSTFTTSFSHFVLHRAVLTPRSIKYSIPVILTMVLITSILDTVFQPGHVITICLYMPNHPFLCKNEVHVLASCLDYFYHVLWFNKCFSGSCYGATHVVVTHTQTNWFQAA